MSDPEFSDVNSVVCSRWGGDDQETYFPFGVIGYAVYFAGFYCLQLACVQFVRIFLKGESCDAVSDQKPLGGDGMEMRNI